MCKVLKFSFFFFKRGSRHGYRLRTVDLKTQLKTAVRNGRNLMMVLEVDACAYLCVSVSVY